LFKIKHLAQAVKVLSQGDRVHLGEPAKCTNKLAQSLACKHSAMPRVNAWPGKQGMGAKKLRY